jgi:hypothetical protein
LVETIVEDEDGGYNFHLGWNIVLKADGGIGLDINTFWHNIEIAYI